MTAPAPSPPVLIFDASALVAWVLQTTGQWKKVDLLMNSAAMCVTPASVLTETIYVAALRGNTTPPAQLHQALVAQGLQVEPFTETDAVRTSELVAESRVNPAPSPRGPKTLSLGDGLVLATAQRLGGVAVTFDTGWWGFPTMSPSFRLLNPANVT